MSIRSRNELKYLFQNNTKLSENQFAELIDSLLNKRDDQFHGKWKEGQAYRVGDVVIHKNALWTLIGIDGQLEVCSNPSNEPSDINPSWESLIIPSSDDDWKVIEDEEVMWAIMHNRIGIGVGNEVSGERPEAKLDIRKEGSGRFMIFPADNTPAQFSLLHYDPSNEKSYLLTSLSLEEASWLTDAANGYIFKKGIPLVPSDQETDPDVNVGQVLMVIKPKKIQGGSELATLGLNTNDPKAMLDVTDNSRGQLLFTPDEKSDPALSIVNLDPECDQNYVAIGVGVDLTALVTDAPDGFAFLQGGEYGEYCNEKNIKQGKLLVSIQLDEDSQKPHLGIGTGEPTAMLEIKDQDSSKILFLPSEAEKTGQSSTGENETLMSLIRLQPQNAKTYFITGLEENHAGWVTNAQNGFVFRQGGPFGAEDNEICLNQGETHVVIREDGKMGIGTTEPYTKLEIANKLNSTGEPSGKFHFNLDRKVNPALGILNLRPGTTANYFTLGADNEHAILLTDSVNGFLFKKGNPIDTNDSQIDVNQGDTLVSIKPEGKGKVGIGLRPKDFQLDVHGMTRCFTAYQLTDETKLDEVRPLENVLDALNELRPIVFSWKIGTDFQAEGEQLGFKAHEVADAFPQVVKSEDGIMAVAYQNLVPALVAGMKELIEDKAKCQTELDQLRLEFEQYKESVDSLLSDIEKRLQECEK